MSTSILSFPHEILAKIFSDSCLSNRDLGRAERSCRLFRANIQEYVATHRRYTFRVDALGHPTWKFIRHLLKNPKLGEQFTDITVKWKRRIASNSNTWTSDWEWTCDEVVLINDVCTAWDIQPQTKSNILKGKNSEALLPLLLCLTPNLKYLDLGSIDHRIINYSHENSEHGLALEAIGSHASGNRDWERYYDQSEEYESQDHTLFFFDNLKYGNTDGTIDGPEHLLPGLTLLETFRIGALDEDAIPFKIEDLFPVFSFPCIRRIEAFNGTDRDGEFYIRTNYTPFSETSSPVRHLTLESHRPQIYEGQRFSFSKEYIETIAKITGNLETLVIKNKRIRIYESTGQEDERIGRIFLAQNKATLKPTKININGGGFSENGRFDEDAAGRRELARKQRLYEQVKAKLGNLKLEPSPFEVLQPELLPNILSFLERSDVYHLMLSSKNFYEACYRDIWSGVAFLDSREPHSNRFALQDDQIVLFRRAAQSFGNPGLKYLKYLEIDHRLLRAYISPGDAELLQLLIGEIESGGMPSLKHLFLNMNIYGSGIFRDDLRYGEKSVHDGHDLLGALKRYSEIQAPADFTLRLHIRVQGAALFNTWCDLTKLTTLELDTVWWWGVEDATKGIETLISLLAAAPSQLKRLTFIGGYYQEMPKDLDSLWEPLQVFQGVISNLKSVTKLAITRGFLFHPSFLLLPPKNVTDLSYGGIVSPSWWQKFAKHPFTGVERLTLSCEVMTDHDNESDVLSSIVLGDVAISGLKWLTIDNNLSPISPRHNLKYPVDLSECLIKKNKQLSRQSLQVIANKKGEKCAEISTKRIPNIVEICTVKLKEQLQEAMRKHAVDFAAKYILERKPLPEEFESEMEKSSIDLLVKQFESEFAANFTKQCAEALRTELGSKNSCDTRMDVVTVTEKHSDEDSD